MKQTANQIANDIIQGIAAEVDRQYYSPGSFDYNDIHDQIVRAIEDAVAPNMTEQKAREILGDIIQEDGELRQMKAYIKYRWISEDNVTLDGGFSANQLEAIAWWMKNMTKYKFESQKAALTS